MDPAPPQEDLETMNLIIVMHNYMQQVNPEPEGVQAEINELIQEKNVLAEQMRNLQQLPFQNFGQFQVWSGRVAMIYASLQELNSQMTLFHERNERIRMSFVPTLIGTRLLEVNNIETPQSVRSLFDDYGWPGTVCYEVEEDDEIFAQIDNIVVGMPRRTLIREDGAPIMWGNVQVL